MSAHPHRGRLHLIASALTCIATCTASLAPASAATASAAPGSAAPGSAAPGSAVPGSAAAPTATAAPTGGGAPSGGPETVTGPIPATARPGDPSRDYVFYATPFDLRRAGYVEQEFFISGTATRYPSNPTPEQQARPATPIGTAPYTTRIVVRRPLRPSRSAGIAVVDWQNVSAGHEIDTEWGTNGDYFVRHGWTWVGASVQRVGVNGATEGGTAGRGLRQWNPRRYGPLDLTAGGTVLDDSQSFDVYTQIAALVEGAPVGGGNPLADLRITRTYAGGASQSGRFLGVYYNTVQPLAQVYDGFVFALSNSSLPPRDGVGTKGIRVFTETDVLRGAGAPSQTVPDTSTRRTWHIAGGSHVPAYTNGEDPGDFRATLGAIQEREFGPAAPVDCVNPGPSRVLSWPVFHAAYDALDRWVRRGVPPRPAQPLAVVSGPQAGVARDANGIALGGIRVPDVEVPVALGDGINAPANLDNPLSAFCVLYGTHRDFTRAQLDLLYYSDRDYRRQVADSVRRLEGQGFVLREDGQVFDDAARERHPVGR